MGRIKRDRLCRVDSCWGLAMMPADPMDSIILVTTLVLIGAVGWEYVRLAYRILKDRKRD